jgi:hypothetical protein
MTKTFKPYTAQRGEAYNNTQAFHRGRHCCFQLERDALQALSDLCGNRSLSRKREVTA